MSYFFSWSKRDKTLIVFQTIKNKLRDSQLNTPVHTYLKHIIELYPHQQSYSKCCTEWTLRRAVFAYGTSTLSLVLFLWCISPRRDWSWGKDTTFGHWNALLVWKWAQRWGREWILISPTGHNVVDLSPERLWHLTEHYKLFCNIYKRNKWPIFMFFKRVSIILTCQYTFSHTIWIKKKKKKNHKRKTEKKKNKHTAHR